ITAGKNTFLGCLTELLISNDALPLIGLKTLGRGSNTIAFLLIGALVAFVVNLIHPISIDWIICITAYIACGVGYIGGIFFLYKKG
ncbi:MAG: hypothetical protein II174_05655, partial [Erysipelotrichaceae bacterium]|nr:hypothetical protein [Erysipelotrichaceae bacterium]